ncbi:hypothetical protein [Azospira sp.]|nr:hypothetical protein [Azospira sp.]MDK9690795.1 hypothetical protein [Azospira sp.]
MGDPEGEEKGREWCGGEGTVEDSKGGGWKGNKDGGLRQWCPVKAVFPA